MSDKDVPERQTTIRLLPTRQPDPGVLRRACKRPRCGNEIDPPAGRSRPREFCSDECRNLYQRERDQARNVLLEARRLAFQYEIDETATGEPSTHGTGSPERPSSSPGPSPSHLALSLVAQALESIRVDLQDGVTLDPEGVLARITRAKEDGDRLLRTYGQNNCL
jgi:predicted nucleic acid-binding Zn ribbon protein